MSVSFWQDSSHHSKVNCDVTIIGAGISGLSCAYWLQKIDPELTIQIVEKNHIAWGASGRNAGFITCGSVEHFHRMLTKHGREEASAIWKFSEQNLDLLKQEIIQEHEGDFLFEQAGSFSLASTETELEELKKSASQMQQEGIAVELLNEEQVFKRLGAQKMVGAIKYLNDASVDPVKLCSGIAKMLNAKRVKINLAQEVYAIETLGQERVVKTNKQQIISSLVILATNAYTYTLYPKFKDYIAPTRGQILATGPVAKFMEGPCYANFVLDYFRQIPTGEVIIGGFRQLQKDVEIGISDETSDLIQSALEKFLKDHLPLLNDAKITHRWAGIMGFSFDGQPLVGALPSDPQISILGGHTAHGLGLAFHCAKVLAEVLIEAKTMPKFLSTKRLM